MKLILPRVHSGKVATISPLFLNGDFECYILEDVIREVPGQNVMTWKIPGKTAIPQGEYDIILNFSSRFKQVMPLLTNVPGYTGVRIHPLNTHMQTDGCLGPGLSYDVNTETILKSSIAYHRLFEKMQEALLRHESISIKIENPK